MGLSFEEKIELNKAFKMNCKGTNCNHPETPEHSRECIEQAAESQGWTDAQLAEALATVPPAGDEVEVLAWVDRDGDFYKERCYPDMKAVILLSHHRAHVTRLTAERDVLQATADKSMRSVVELATAMTRDVPDLSRKFELFETVWGVVGQIDNMYAGMRAERDGLLAEVERLQKVVTQGRLDADESEKSKCLAQSDLTKARELLSESMPALDLSAGAFKSAKAIRSKVREFLAHQPAPAAKGDQCICEWSQRQFCGCFRPGICDKPKNAPAADGDGDE